MSVSSVSAFSMLFLRFLDAFQCKNVEFFLPNVYTG